MSFSSGSMNHRRLWMLIICGVGLIIALACTGNMFESVDAGDIMVVQAPMSGQLTFHTTPGIKWQGFGTVTTYRKRGQFSFYDKDDKNGDSSSTGAIKVRFNDGAHGAISGSLAYELPLDTKQLTELHAKYNNQEAIQQQLIRPIVEKAVYLTGPQMSSTESVAEKRNDLLFLVDDQSQNGVYKTRTVQQQQPDPITHQMKTVSVVELQKDEKGNYIRAERSPLNEFGITVFNLSMKEIRYDNAIEDQIKQQQEAKMKVQLAIAQAKEAEQRAELAAKEGEANAAKSKWEQEVVKIKAVTEAEQRFEVAVKESQQKLEVAKLATMAAEQFKQTETLMGEGEAARRKANMDADGALDKRLETWERVNMKYAEAMEKHTGNFTPQVVIGGGGGYPATAGMPANAYATGGGTLQSFMDMLMIKTAKDLALDLDFSRQQQKQTASTQK